MKAEGCSAAIETYKACLTALEALERQDDAQLDEYLDGLTVEEHQRGVIEGLRRIADKLEIQIDDEEASNDADAD